MHTFTSPNASSNKHSFFLQEAETLRLWEGTPTSILSLILVLSNVVLCAKHRLDGFKPSLHDRCYASAVLGMALCLSQMEFCQKGAQVGYSATYSPVVGQTNLTTLATVDGQFITQTVRLSTARG